MKRETMKIAPILIGMAILASIITPPAMASVLCCYYETSAPSSLQISSGTAPHGYMTNGVASGASTDTTFDARSATKWNLATASYKINMADSIPASGYSQADLRAKIVEAEDNWYSTLSSTTAPLIEFTDGGSTTAKPSLFGDLCSGGSSTSNNINEIGFCDFPGADSGGMVKLKLAQSSGVVTIQNEADMVFDSATTWAPTGSNEMYNVALHEFGHWYGLGDLYALKGLSCSGETTPRPEMCDANTGSLQWGDKDGIRWLYPKVNSFSLAASGTITGSDSAMALIGGASSPDMIFVWGDYSSTTGQTTIKAKGIWDISSSTGAGTTGTTVNLYTVTGQVLDVGATLFIVDSGDTIYDLIVSYTVGTSGSSYLVFWDLAKSSNSFTYTGPAGPYSVTGSSGDKGTDLVVYDLTNDGNRDLVVVGSDSSPLKVWYYYGTLSTSGTVSSWTTGSSSGTIGINTEDAIGLQKPNVGDGKIYTVAYRSDSGYMRQHLLHITTAGAIDASITSKYAPPKSTGGSVTGIGAGDVWSLGEVAAHPEEFFSWTDTNTGYYTIEWDTRLNSHA
ncbi:MAG: hypothetical protein HRF40_04470 [Nitrososphaera sp.]